MCGIAGWYDPAPCSESDRLLLQKMTSLLVHRGPDDSGVFLSQPVRFGHRRLSIIDIEGGRQPMSDESGRRVVVFNGEIYNFLELRRALEKSGYSFRTNSDTEVLLAMYDRHGTDCLRYLNGMFAFALWDGKEQRLILARDRLGIKPLYYTVLGGDRILFASEIKALLCFPGVEREASIASISSYLSFRRPLGTDTFFKGISSLAPGTYMEVANGRICIRRYWDLPSDKYETVTTGDLFEKTGYLLEAAVRRRMISDVPLGAFLSGGLDSSAIVAIMAECGEEPVKTYSIGFTQKDYNELGYARKVARLFETDHHEIIMDEEDYLGLMSRLIRYKDEPLSVANEIALYRLSRHLKERITVVLSGEGADELFVGYGRIFRSAYDYQRLTDELFMKGPDGGQFEKAAKERYGRTVFEDEADHFLSLYEYVGRAEKIRLFTADAWNELDEDRALRHYVRSTFDKLGYLSQEDKYVHFFQQFHLENLLRRVDMTTMANSVEARVPFVDHELVEHVYRLPFGRKLPWKSERDRAMAASLTSDNISEVHDIPKHLLKAIMNNRLPEEITNRRKMGFPVPLDRYCAGSFLKYAREVLQDATAEARGIFDTQALRSDFDRVENGGKTAPHRAALKIWMLLNVELWWRFYIDETDLEPVEREREPSLAT